jgi:hypothetical protein
MLCNRRTTPFSADAKRMAAQVKTGPISMCNFAVNMLGISVFFVSLFDVRFGSLAVMTGWIGLP